MEETVFNKLFNINVNEYVEERDGLTYLTWSKAWAEVKKIYDKATYEIKKFENNLPYVYDEDTGYMVFTSVTIEDLTYEMWLPVMDSKNKAMLNHPYEYTTKYGTKTVEKATMFDINKTIMRCLVKNLAMFGLGLYIYSGEDLPEIDKKNKEEETEKLREQVIEETMHKALIKAIENKGITDMEVLQIIEKYGYTSTNQIKMKDYKAVCDDFSKLSKK